MADSFELIFALDVLEHVKEDSRALREVHRVAAPRGRLVMMVPAYSWLWSAQNDSHDHLRRYTRRPLIERTAASGWRPWFATLLPASAIAALRRLRREYGARSDYEATPSSIDGLLALPMRAEAGLIRRCSGFRQGSRSRWFASESERAV